MIAAIKTLADEIRDKEKKLLAQLKSEKDSWEEETKTRRYKVDEENVAEVIAMMTGIPTKRVAQKEGEKLILESKMYYKCLGTL